MSVREEFNKTIRAVEQVLEQPHDHPRDIRNAIKALVTSYHANEVVQQSYRNFDDSGVLQWKNFLRASNVRDQEPMTEYVNRIHGNLVEMQRFENQFLRPKALAA